MKNHDSHTDADSQQAGRGASNAASDMQRERMAESSGNQLPARLPVKYPFLCLSDLIAIRRKIHKKRKLVIDLSYTHYQIIRTVSQQLLNWSIVFSSNKLRYDWNIMWTDQYISESYLRLIHSYQKINHFPGSYYLGKKHYLALHLQRMRQGFPAEYEYFPRTWVLPKDYQDLIAYAESNGNNVYIVKPQAQCQGRGIYLTTNIASLNQEDEYVVQHYIPNPLLIDDLKFDFRIYVLVKDICNLEVYMYQEGLARFATTPYQTPAPDNLEDYTMHLTNYAINKKNPLYQYNVHENSDDQGHKRSISSILKVRHAPSPSRTPARALLAGPAPLAQADVTASNCTHSETVRGREGHRQAAQRHQTNHQQHHNQHHAQAAAEVPEQRQQKHPLLCVL